MHAGESASPSRFFTQTERGPERLTLVLTGPCIDGTLADELSAELVRQVAGQTQVQIDLSAIRYLDIAGFDALLSAVSSCPGVVRFTGVGRPLRSLFVLSHLDILVDE